MAQFSYETYSAQQAARRASSGTGGSRNQTSTRFVNEWLKNDGDSVVVRFPYHSMDDIKFETTHTVTFPGERFGKRVRCEGDSCPLCKQGVKVDTRFFVKAIVYVTDPASGGVTLVPAIWDRPAAFADIDLKNLMQDYGDLTESLFKIKRNGAGLDTRYTISIITNRAVYNPDVYKADFSGLESIDPTRILTKTVEQYMKALNPEAETQKSSNLDKIISSPKEEKAIETALGMEETHINPARVVQPQVTPTTTNTTTQTTPSSDNTTRPKRYTF